MRSDLSPWQDLTRLSSRGFLCMFIRDDKNTQFFRNIRNTQLSLCRDPMIPAGLDAQQLLYNGPHDVPRNYNTIASSVNVHPATYPPTVPAPPMDTTQIKAVPIGLEYLLQLNQLVVREKFSTFQGQSRFFDVLDPAGQRILQATQESLCCEPFYNLKITDNNNRELLEIVQECECTFTKQVYVYVLGVNLIGMVKLHLNSFVTHLSVMNPSQDVMLHIIGPGFQTNVFGNCCFEVKSRDEQHVVGMIKTENGQFFLTFPLDLDVSVKALLLGGCFFLDNLISSHKRQLTAPRTNNWQNRQQGYQPAYAW